MSIPNSSQLFKLYTSYAKNASRNAPLWVDHNMHVVQGSHQAHVLSMVKPLYPCSSNSFQGKHPYGSTIKCPSWYGAIRPSMAPCAFYGGNVPMVFQFISRKTPLWVDHKMHVVLWSHQALHGSMCFLWSSHCAYGRPIHFKENTPMGRP